MPKFRELEELSICISPDAKWWEVEVMEAILENLHSLPCLHTLKLYLPTEKELQYFLRLEIAQEPIYLTLHDFSLQVGHIEHFTSYLKTKLVDSFEKLEKCLKYENGEGSTNDIRELVRHANALFLCRHWTIEKLSVFDVSKLKYCLLAECNEMHNVIDAAELYGDRMITHDNDEKDAFGFLEYLAIHSMKKLQSIWKGPVARNSFSCLQVLALHTCPDLTTVFTECMLGKLDKLTVVIVEDCPKLNNLVSWESTHGIDYRCLLPSLRKLLLLDLPELVSLSNGVPLAPQLDTLLVFNCLKLDYLSHDELSRDVKEIKGEAEWWDALKNRDQYARAFIPLKRDGVLMNQLAEDTNSLKEFHKLQRRGGASVPDSQQFPARFSLNETNNHFEWGEFMQFLNYREPRVHLVQCNSGHVIEFLKHLNKFGDIKFHVKSCALFAHPNPAATCFCPFMEAWGTLEVIATRLQAAYEDNRFPGMEPFSGSDIQSYLNKVRKSQENALGIPSKKHSIEWRHENSPPGKAGDLRAGTKSITHTKVPKRGAIIRRVINEIMHPVKSGDESQYAGTGTKASTKLQDSVLNVSVSHSLTMEIRSNEIVLLLDEFRTILQVKPKTRKHISSSNSDSTTLLEILRQGSSSIHEVKEDDYVISNTMLLKEISHLRTIAAKASSKGCMQSIVEIYIAERKIRLESRLAHLNNDNWSTYDVKKFKWGVLESLIEIWIRSVKTSFDYLFANEKQLCEAVFQGLGTDIEGILVEVVIQHYQIQVFNIIYTLSFSNPPPDKIFMILDLYETLDHFLNDKCSFAKPRDPSQATVHMQLLTMLADKICGSLSVFDMVLLYHESPVIFVGPVDRLPKYVMSYICQLCDHTHTLKKLSLPNLPSVDEDDLSSYSEEFKGQSELSCHVIWIIMMIMSNLESKAKLCEDGSAGHFFAMKNICYIIQKIEEHQELREVVGYDYIGKLIQKFDNAKVSYLRLELEKITVMRDYGAE